MAFPSTEDTLDTADVNEQEHFVTIGLKSNIKAKDFSRRKLNLVVVLDISGSMTSGWGNSWGRHENSKMKTANEAVLSLLTHLDADDRFGLVLFDDRSTTHIALKRVGELDLAQVANIVQIRPRGGTNFEIGYDAGIKMLTSLPRDKAYEDRLIFLTDAQPNAGRTDAKSLLGMVSAAASRGSFTTFVGVGLDFNADLISQISKVRGANYFCVRSSAQFLRALDDEFDYFVSPLVFDLGLVLQREGAADNGCIEAVFGSNSKTKRMDLATGEVLRINTLFPSKPSKKRKGKSKGGVVLIKLKQQRADDAYDHVVVRCSFEDRDGRVHSNEQRVSLKLKDEVPEDLALRKGVLLTRYVLLMREWIASTKSAQLSVSARFKRIFGSFVKHFRAEMEVLQDADLQREVDLLNQLINVS